MCCAVQWCHDVCVCVVQFDDAMTCVCVVQFNGAMTCVCVLCSLVMPCPLLACIHLCLSFLSFCVYFAECVCVCLWRCVWVGEMEGDWQLSPRLSPPSVPGWCRQWECRRLVSVEMVAMFSVALLSGKSSLPSSQR